MANEWAKLLRTSGILQSVIQLMEDNHPARHALHGDKNEDVSPTRASIELGVTRGYSMYADRLKILAEPIKRIGDIGEPTYQPETVEESQ